MKTHTHSFIVLVLFLFVSFGYLVMAINYPIAYIWTTYEDLLGEWAQFYFFLFALFFSIRLSFVNNKYRYFFILLSVACFYVIMEEISWGQRLFGWDSSDFFKTHNLQGETNLHNMLTGPYSTLLKKTLTYLLSLGLAVYGFIYPLLIKFKIKPALFLLNIGIAAPPLYLAPLFITSAILEMGLLSFNEAEITELLVGMALAIFSLHYFFSFQNHLAYDEKDWTTTDSTQLSYKFLYLSFLVVLLSIATTFSLYATDAGKKRADRRIFNGIEKFAARYKNYGRWDQVISLNEMLLAKRPKSRPYLRNMAKAYKKMGDSKLANKYFNKAIALDLKKIKKYPGKTSGYQSLARSFRDSGDKKMADNYLSKALELGLKRIKAHPKSANAMYSLGRTYELMRNNNKAKKLFADAYTTKPESKKFRKAYYRYHK